MKKVAIIVAGGRGTRFGAELPKQFVEFHGFPVLMRSIARFLLSGVCDEFIVVLPQDQFGLWNELCSKYYFNLPHQLVAGGETRFQSVKNALAAISVELGDLVAVHDGVRPLVQPTYIAKAYDEAAQYGSAVPLAAFPYSSSLRQVLPDGTTAVVPREALREVQTPQVFNAVELLKAYEVEYDPRFTDDATVFESVGHIIHPIEGDPDNIKITRPEDLERAESILAEQQTRIDAEPDIAYEEMVMSHYAHDILNLPWLDEESDNHT